MVTFSSCIKPFFDLLYFISKVDETIYILKMAGPWLLASSLIINNAKEASLKSRGDIQQVTKNINQAKTNTSEKRSHYLLCQFSSIGMVLINMRKQTKYWYINGYVPGELKTIS